MTIFNSSHAQASERISLGRLEPSHF